MEQNVTYVSRMRTGTAPKLTWKITSAATAG